MASKRLERKALTTGQVAFRGATLRLVAPSSGVTPTSGRGFGPPLVPLRLQAGEIRPKTQVHGQAEAEGRIPTRDPPLVKKRHDTARAEWDDARAIVGQATVVGRTAL
jgi:hypothetical protein